MTNITYLLDLNYTLVEASYGDGSEKLAMEKRLQTERYRTWLVDLLRGEHVIMITARPAQWKDATLARIRETTGWGPSEAYFNWTKLPPPVLKERVLLRMVFRARGLRPGQCFAIESNPKTRAMYARHGVRSTSVRAVIWSNLGQMIAQAE